jgi:hypothetical protein
VGTMIHASSPDTVFLIKVWQLAAQRTETLCSTSLLKGLLEAFCSGNTLAAIPWRTVKPEWEAQPAWPCLVCHNLGSHTLWNPLGSLPLSFSSFVLTEPNPLGTTTAEPGDSVPADPPLPATPFLLVNFRLKSQVTGQSEIGRLGLTRRPGRPSKARELHLWLFSQTS